MSVIDGFLLLPMRGVTVCENPSRYSSHRPQSWTLFLVADTALSVHWSVGPSLCDALVEKFAAVVIV